MAIRIGIGGGSANGGTGKGGLLPMGLVLTAFGLLLAWLAGLHRLVRNRAPGLAVMGGLFVGWGVVGGVAAARNRFWIGVLVCAVLLFVGLLLLGVVPLPAWGQRAVAAVRKIGLGLAFMGAGLVIIAAGLGGGASEGVPAFVPVAAGLVFFLGGVLAALHEGGGGRDTVLSRIFAALIVTGLAAAGVVFPPSLLFTAPFAVLSWIAVVRLVIEKRTGSDPLAGWSDGRMLGLGCGITVLIGILIIAVVQLRSCVREPEARPPAEAVGDSLAPEPTGSTPAGFRRA